ncbi:unnamed protein product, partial [Ectocarpus sp. 8 AP-2014]
QQWYCSNHLCPAVHVDAAGGKWREARTREKKAGHVFSFCGSSSCAVRSLILVLLVLLWLCFVCLSLNLPASVPLHRIVRGRSGRGAAWRAEPVCRRREDYRKRRREKW